MNHLSRFLLVLATSIVVLLATSGSAFAGTIRYDIAPSPAYTVDNDSGIAKITYRGCVTQSAVQTVKFTTVIEGGTPGTAEYKVLQDPSDEGELPAGTFNPPSVTVTGTGEQTFNTTLSFTLKEISPSGTVFRFKLSPETAIGLGEGPGVMVIIECVQPKTLVAPAGPPVAGTSEVPTVPVPTAVAGVAAGPSPCVSVHRVTLRVNRTSRLNIVVRTAAGVRVNRAFVRITGPGILMSRFTNAHGLVRFNVRPRRRGVIIVQSNVCIGADRTPVLGAFAGATGAGTGRPAFTG